MRSSTPSPPTASESTTQHTRGRGRKRNLPARAEGLRLPAAFQLVPEREGTRERASLPLHLRELFSYEVSSDTRPPHQLRCDAIRLRNPRRSAGSPEAGRVEDHLRPVTGGTYDSRAGAYVHKVLPGGASGDTGEPAGTGRGMGAQRMDRCSGSGDLGGGRREPGGPVWPLEVPVRGAVTHRPRPVGISGQARSVTAGAGPGLPRTGKLIGRPCANQRPVVVDDASSSRR